MQSLLGNANMIKTLFITLINPISRSEVQNRAINQLHGYQKRTKKNSISIPIFKNPQ